MTPVINPWVFYVVSVVDKLKWFAILAIICALIVLGVYAVSCSIECEDINKKMVKFGLKLVGICAAVVIILPGSTTITKMLVAENVTYERVGAAADTVVSVYEDIMALFDKDNETE